MPLTTFFSKLRLDYSNSVLKVLVINNLKNHSSWYIKCILLIFFTTLSFVVFVVICFFLLIHFLVAEDYEFFQSTIDLLLAPLPLENIRILSSFISFCINCLPDNILCKTAIWADDTVLITTCEKVSGLP